MEIILTKDVDNLGSRNEVVRVKDGFARNYLLPKNMAIPANSGNLRSRSGKIKMAQEARDKRVIEAQEIADKLNGKTFIILAKSGKEGRLFGSVTTQDVVGAIFHFAGIEIDRRRVNLTAPIKDLGAYQINIKLTQGVTAAVHLDVRPDVLPEDEPAPAQNAAPVPVEEEMVDTEEAPVEGEPAPEDAASAPDAP